MLSDLALQAVLNVFINGNPTLNGAFSTLCINKGVPVPTSAGASPSAPFTINLNASPGSPTFWNGIASIDQLETQGMIQYPFLMVGTIPEKQPTDWRIRPSTFSGTLGVDVRAWLAWWRGEPPTANDFNTQFQLLKRAFYMVINGPNNQGMWLPGITGKWGAGQIIYNGDLNCTLEGPMQLCNNGSDWRREMRFVATFRGIL
jgi:hypothetical protein